MKSQLNVIKGGQSPRVRLAPKWKSNSAAEVIELCAGYGLYLDEWQQNCLWDILGEQKNGLWAANRVGIAVPRQNGKGELLIALELAGMLLFDEKLIVHSAHEYKTAADGFRRIWDYFENYDDLRKKIRRFGTATSREFITLKGGNTLKFFARTKGSGRGFSADRLILDEAQELSDDSWAAMLPTVSARPNPQVILTGTPPAPNMNGEVFTRFRANGLAGTAKRFTWLEWSCDNDVDLDDPTNWATANPELNYRIAEEKILDERSSMDDDTFGRERLGMWESTSSGRIFDEMTWKIQEDPMSLAVNNYSLGIDVNPERTRASVAIAGKRIDGLSHFELEECRSGTGWVVPYVTALCRLNNIRCVVVDLSSAAASMVPDLKRNKIKVIETTAGDMANACGDIYDQVKNGRAFHTGQPQMTQAMAGTRKRALLDRYAWNRKNTMTDITPFVAATLALFGTSNHARAVRPPGKKVLVIAS